MLSNPNKLMEGRFEKLEHDGRLVQVVPYLTVDKVFEIEDVLEAFYFGYNLNSSTKSKMHKIPDIYNFISSSDHFCITEYTLEYCLCVKQGCIVCSKI